MAIIGADSSAYATSAPPPRAGSVEKFAVAADPAPAPAGTFTDQSGKAHSLADYRGRVVLLNFWATWCAPCVKEMPSLAKLQTRLAGPGFTVVALSEDRQGWKKIAPFRDRHKLGALPIFHDEKSTLMFAIKARGLPTTLLIGRKGRVLGRLTGPADWDSREAVALLKHYIDGGAVD